MALKIMGSHGGISRRHPDVGLQRHLERGALNMWVRHVGFCILTMKYHHLPLSSLRRALWVRLAWLTGTLYGLCGLCGPTFAQVQTSPPASSWSSCMARRRWPASQANKVADLYLGRTRHLSNGQTANPLDNPAASAVRALYKALTGKAITDINAYWARLLFTGQSSPPQPMADANALIEAVRNTPGAMAYLDQSQLPANPEALGIRVILNMPAP